MRAAAASESSDFERAVELVLDDVRPMLRMDGGNVELVSADQQSGRVEVHLVGACGHCPASGYTLSFAIEAKLKAKLADVREVIAL